MSTTSSAATLSEADELEVLDRKWKAAGTHPEDYFALAAVLRELEESALVQGRARAATLLTIGWARAMRGETAQLTDLTKNALRFAQESSDLYLEFDAQALTGDVLQAKGQLEEAAAAFGEALAINRRLAERDPNNADWQRDLAVTHGRVGGVLLAQGQLEEAAAAVGEYRAISRRLAERDPSNADWQRELAVAHGRVGGVLLAKGQLEEAAAAFSEALAINRRLAERDPSNADWQRNLAVACWWQASFERRASHFEAAEKLYEESLRIFSDLVVRAPQFVAWQKERKDVEDELKTFREEQARLRRLGDA
jgi:tetratricopeptide (TPR) repeat protein